MVVRFFAKLREEAGISELRLEVREGLTLGELLGRLFERKPEGLLVAVNGEAVGPEELGGVRLKEGDVIDLMPPASGG